MTTTTVNAKRHGAPLGSGGLGSAIAQTPNGDLTGIQYARALAAMMVVVHHLEPQFLRMGFAPPMWSGLSSGVDIFFVISGMIMWVTTCDRDISPLTFLYRRFARIVPLYWLATTATVIVMIVVPSALQTGRFDLYHVLASYAFLAWPSPATGQYEPVVIPGWTLNYEMLFYLVFSLLLLARRSKRLLLASSFFVLLALAGLIPGVARNGEAAFYTSPLMLEFVFGMGLGELYARTGLLKAISPRWAVFIALSGIVFILIGPSLAPDVSRFLLRGIPALAVVTGVLALDAQGAVRENWLLLLLGNASYSLYLTHPFVLSALSQFWRKRHLDHLPLGLWLFAALAITLSCLLAALSYRLVELPLIGFFRRRRR